jgi:hypothetical protein
MEGKRMKGYTHVDYRQETIREQPGQPKSHGTMLSGDAALESPLQQQ